MFFVLKSVRRADRPLKKAAVKRQGRLPIISGIVMRTKIPDFVMRCIIGFDATPCHFDATSCHKSKNAYKLTR